MVWPETVFTVSTPELTFSLPEMMDREFLYVIMLPGSTGTLLQQQYVYEPPLAAEQYTINRIWKSPGLS